LFETEVELLDELDELVVVLGVLDDEELGAEDELDEPDVLEALLAPGVARMNILTPRITRTATAATPTYLLFKQDSHFFESNLSTTNDDNHLFIFMRLGIMVNARRARL
jgi:hypothetical protein